jgi:hypothetical protein
LSARHRDVEVQNQRDESEQAEDDHVRHQQHVGHALATPEALSVLHRESRQIAEKFRDLRQPVGAVCQQPKATAADPQEAKKDKADACGAHLSAAIAPP